MARVCYYFVFACFCLALNSERNVQASDTLRCQAVMAGIKMNSSWAVRYAQKVIAWLRPSNGSPVIPCYCNPAVGGLGNVTRIQYTNSSTGVVYSNTLCSGCPGLQVAVTDFSYSVGVIENGTSHTDTGPCSEIPVYRCSCPGPTTTTRPATGSTMTTKGADPYYP